MAELSQALNFDLPLRKRAGKATAAHEIIQHAVDNDALPALRQLLEKSRPELFGASQ